MNAVEVKNSPEAMEAIMGAVGCDSGMRSITGRQNRAAGKRFEEYIDAALAWYAANQLAAVQKTPEPVKVLSRVDNRGRFTACFEKAAQPDYKGVLEGGRCIVFDAKHTNQERIWQSAVTDEQARILDEYEKLEAVCLIMCGIRGRCYAVPWEHWKSAQKGHRYFTWQELADCEVSFPEILKRVF